MKKLLAVLISVAMMLTLLPGMADEAEGALILPRVIYTVPYDGEENTSLNFTMVIEFNKGMDTSSVEENFVIEPYIEGVFEWYYDNTTMLFGALTLYEKDTWYNVTIKGNAKDPLGLTLDGNNNTYPEGSPWDDYTFTFFTDQPPRVQMTTPYNNQHDVDAFQPYIYIQFNLPMVIGTVMNGTGIQIYGDHPGDPIGLNVTSYSWYAMNSRVYINLGPLGLGDYTLEYGRMYTIKLIADIVQATNGWFLDGNYNGWPDGSPMDDYYLHFDVEDGLQLISPDVPGLPGYVSEDIELEFSRAFSTGDEDYLDVTVYNFDDSEYVPIDVDIFGTDVDISPDFTTHENFWKGETRHDVTISGDSYIDAGEGRYYFDGDGDGKPEGSPDDDVVFTWDTYETKKVTSTTPDDGHMNVLVGDELIMYFGGGDVLMHPSQTYIDISPPVDGTWEWGEPGVTSVTFTPDFRWNYSTTYTITVSGDSRTLELPPPWGVPWMYLDGNEDEYLDGSPDDDYIFTFTTEPDLIDPRLSGYGTLKEGQYTYENWTTIVANYFDSETGVDTSKVYLTVNDENYTSLAEITGTKLTYRLKNLTNGFYTVNLTIYDYGGNYIFKSWTFEVHKYTPDQVGTDMIEVGFMIVIFGLVAGGGVAIVKTGQKSGRIGGKKGGKK